MKNILLSIWNKILDNLINTFITAIFATLASLEFFTKIKPITQLIIPFLMWKWSGWIVLIVVIVVLYIRNEIAKKRTNTQGIIRKPPKYHASFEKKAEEREFAGVIWKIFVGSNVNSSITELNRESVFAWPFPHAYCPECDYELERKRTNWYCMPCKKNYKIPRELQDNTWEKIRRNYERLVVKWGYNNFGIADDNHKPFRVILRENKRKKEEGQKEISKSKK